MAVVCPYCLEALKSNEVHRVCNICGGKYTPGAFEGLMLRSGRVPKCKSTAGCLGQYAVLQCAKCGHELPADIAQYDKYVRFAVVAPSGAGKSNFITTMLEEAKRNRHLNFLITSMNRETQDHHNECVDYIYNRQRPVPATTAGTVIPMQWRIQDLNRATKTTVPPYSVTIFDGAGEDQSNLDPTICRYIAGSKMIVLLLDPTKLAGVREQMTADEITKAGGTSKMVTREETQDFINGLINYLKTACSIRTSSKITVPVAVVFGKIDAVASKLGSALVLTESGHAAQGKFIQAEADNIHAEIDGWMDVCGDNLTKLFNANFTNWRYFGVSSFGMLPEGRDKLQKPMPLRVLDPLIWDLSLEGIVPTVK